MFIGLSLFVLGIASVGLLVMLRQKPRQVHIAQIENEQLDLDNPEMSCDYVDREEMLRDSELAPLLHRFEAGLVEQLETWRKLLLSEDWDELQRLMHRLQGAAGVYCHSQLSEASRQAENALKELRLENFKEHFHYIEKYIHCFAEKYLKNSN